MVIATLEPQPVLGFDNGRMPRNPGIKDLPYLVEIIGMRQVADSCRVSAYVFKGHAEELLGTFAHVVV